MSKPVDRLKELLFDDEAKERQELANRIEAVFERAGTEERFRGAVARVLDTALHEAETERHHELSEAVAPLIVRTIRTEILNSRDEMVEALYPITGRMVKAYVASAIRDLAAQINRSVDSNPLMLRLRSVVSGKSIAELALADSAGLQLDGLYLIRRGTGELVCYWPQTSDDPRNHVMSGVLAAINEFAGDAFGQDTNALRQIDVGDAHVYLRATPMYLLAARCNGLAPAAAERLIDDAFLSTIADYQARPSGDVPLSFGPQLNRLSDELKTGFSGLATRERASGLSPAAVGLGALAAIALAYICWTAYASFNRNVARLAAISAIATQPSAKSYPISIDVGRYGERVALTGLTPNEAVKSGILADLRRSLPGSHVEDHLRALPSPEGDIGSAIEATAVASALKRTAERLQQVRTDLPQLLAGLDRPADRETVQRITALVKAATGEARDTASNLHKKPDAQAALAKSLQQSATDLVGLVSKEPAKDTVDPDATGTMDASRHLELAAERLAIVTAAMVQTNAVRRNIPPPQPQIVRAPDITDFERLAVWVRTHAIFFGDEVAYRDDAHAEATLDQLAKLMKGTEALVRIVGYTDVKGAADRNFTLSDSRARKVADALMSRGVPSTRLTAVGRNDTNQIAAGIGETSPNRRVEFELGFDGEAGQ